MNEPGRPRFRLEHPCRSNGTRVGAGSRRLSRCGVTSDFDILLAIHGEDSDGETMRFAWSLRRVPASQISLTAPHLHRLHLGPCLALGPLGLKYPIQCDVLCDVT